MRIIALLLVALVAVLALISPKKEPEPRVETALLPVYQRVCQQCHGATGEGNATLKTPSIAGQPAWYLTVQLAKFRSGQRGTDALDIYGQQMRAIALSLSEVELEEATETVISFPARPTQPTFEGDLANGKLIYNEQCIDCHRYNGSGEKVFGSSPLTAFQDWYLAAQIEKFRQGIRGYHPEDEKGLQMRHLISYLDESDCRDVAAYIASLAERYPPTKRR